MPRLPFARCLCVQVSIVRLVLAAVFVWTCSLAASAAPPNPVITAKATRGQAPFAVHVHGLASSLNAGHESTARYEWDFGDAAGRYNQLVGWNAAHVYDVPGTYLLRLKVTNQSWESAVAMLQIIVDPPARTAVYISPSGNDNNSGASPSQALRTLDRAQDFMADDRAFYLQRGAVFNEAGLSTGNRNVLISAYGAGADPVIRYPHSGSFLKILQTKDAARDVVIENLQLESVFAPAKDIVRGVEARGSNITVRNCRFRNLSDALNSGGGGAYGLLSLDNTCETLGAYYIWIEGSDHTHLGNSVAESVEEHNIRIGGASRVLIADNDLTNDNKSSIWCMVGDHCWIAGNRLYQGRLITGPNFAVVYQEERFRHAVADGNVFTHAQAVMYDGAENITLRNNIFQADGLEAVSIWGYSASRNRTTRDISVFNNTLVNGSSNYGRCLKIGDGAQNVSVMNNIYAAPSLNGHNGGNVVCDSQSLVSHVFQRNIWSNPQVGPRWHELDGSSLNASEWSALPQTAVETHRSFSSSDLNPLYMPTFNAAMGVPVPGVFVDLYGNQRSTTSAWIVGAVAGVPELSLGDVNGDGQVNVSDLLQVIGGWGSCTGCPADVNNDGVINVTDLMIVIGQWG